ncbi:MAG: HAD domain-containing protein [Pseudomonadota bacterium]
MYNENVVYKGREIYNQNHQVTFWDLHFYIVEKAEEIYLLQELDTHTKKYQTIKESDDLNQLITQIEAYEKEKLDDLFRLNGMSEDFIKFYHEPFGKVIFLDIDGVLQKISSQKRFKHLDSVKALREKYAKYNDADFQSLNHYDMAAVQYDWSEEAVGMLKLICEYTGCKIVISSDWQGSNDLKQLQLLFSLHDLDKYLVDVTGYFHYSKSRADNIKEYLRVKRHKQIENFVIIDDNWAHAIDIKEIFADNFVKTDYVLTEKEAKKVLEILQKT